MAMSVTVMLLAAQATIGTPAATMSQTMSTYAVVGLLGNEGCNGFGINSTSSRPPRCFARPRFRQRRCRRGIGPDRVVAVTPAVHTLLGVTNYLLVAVQVLSLSAFCCCVQIGAHCVQIWGGVLSQIGVSPREGDIPHRSSANPPWTGTLARRIGTVSKRTGPLWGQDQPWEPRIDNGYPNVVRTPTGEWRMWCVPNLGHSLCLVVPVSYCTSIAPM